MALAGVTAMLVRVGDTVIADVAVFVSNVAVMVAVPAAAAVTRPLTFTVAMLFALLAYVEVVVTTRVLLSE